MYCFGPTHHRIPTIPEPTLLASSGTVKNQSDRHLSTVQFILSRWDQLCFNHNSPMGKSTQDNVLTKVTLRRVGLTFLAVEKQ